MRRRLILGLLVLIGCSTNPYTGRSQLILIDPNTEQALGSQGYQQLLAEYKVATDPAVVEPVVRIGREIADVADQPDYQWEFNVLDEPEIINAVCAPGGKVAVWTGIFPVAENEAGLAVILGHEVAHALARHGAERISQGMLAQVGAITLGAALSGTSNSTYQMAMAAYGLGIQFGVLLPFSRSHESEADRVGLLLAARAGYDPREAIKVWQRFSEIAPNRTPEFLSTHPSHETRIQDFEAMMPEALAEYEKSSKKPNRPLPRIRNLRSEPAPYGAQPAVPVFQGTAHRGRLENGSPAVTFQFTPDRDFYLQRIEVSLPGGGVTPIDVRMGLVEGVTKVFSIWRENRTDELPSGTYPVKFVGEISGRPFEATHSFSVN
jgi:predicted Zn-dependent protease